MILFFSVTQAGKYRGQGPPWPPFRIPGPCNPAYEDPRKLLRSRVFHAMAFVILYKAVHRRNVSEHLLALALYLLEMAVESAEPFDQLSQVVFHFKCHSVFDEHGRYFCSVSNTCFEVLVRSCISILRWSEKFSASTIDGNTIGKIFFLHKHPCEIASHSIK
jgi:hypothetical protein